MARPRNKPNLIIAPASSFDRGKGYDRDHAQDKEASWIEHHGERFQPVPGVFAMSWRWPKWWGVPEVFTKPEEAPSTRIPIDPEDRAELLRLRQTFYKNGLPARLLKFWSGTQVWQLLTPVHGFDEPGATLPDPRDTPFFPN